jgi:hypothetical protein
MINSWKSLVYAVDQMRRLQKREDLKNKPELFFRLKKLEGEVDEICGRRLRNGTARKTSLKARAPMNILKRGVRFASQDTDFPILEEEIPLIVINLTPAGMRRLAILGLHYLRGMGYSINKALEILGDKPPKEKP